MIILGITNPPSNNAAAALVRDGEILSAVEEERFTRTKQSPNMFPINAIEWCLKNSGISYDEVDIIATTWDGYHSKKEIEYHFSEEQKAEADFFSDCMRIEKLYLNFIKKRFKNPRIVNVRHHIAHAASSCMVSGFEKSLFLTFDGRGEYESGIMGIYENGDFQILRRLSRYESLGEFYGKFTSLLGFKSHFEEGKTMGLAPYGNPIKSLMDIVKIDKSGKLIIDGHRITTLEQNSFPGDDPTKDERKDIAATAQYLLEKCALSLVEQLKEVSNISKICLAGGTALNIDVNSKILNSDGIEDIFIQPASSDAGGALGAALYVHHQYSSKKICAMEDAYLGPEIIHSEVEEYLENSNISYKQLSDVPNEIAKILSENKIVAWVQGRAEFGPRALGSRSLLANPANPEMWKKLNKVKGREYWRPLAPSVIEEKTSDYFSNKKLKSPFMLLSSKVKNEQKEKIPAVVHVDGTARQQTVSKKSNQLYWELLNEFEKINGIPVLINTSLNLRGDPLVNSIQDCLKTFYSSEIDYLCIGDYLISRYWANSLVI